MKKGIFNFLLVFFVALLLSATAFATEIVGRGYCGGDGDGTNLTWTLDEHGTLTIDGTGRMADYDGTKEDFSPWSPWRTDSKSVKSVSIGTEVTSIGSEAFWGTEITSITIPNNIQTIGVRAFRGCESLRDATIGGGVIGASAFWQCSDVNFTLLEGVTRIEESALSEASSISIPDSVVYIDKEAFHTYTGANNNLCTINVKAGNRAYCSENDVLFDKEMTEIIIFPMQKTWGHYTVPDGVKKISTSFYPWDNVPSSFSIPISVTSINMLIALPNPEEDKLPDIYYAGSEEQWDKIQLDGDMNPYGGHIYFNSKGPGNNIVMYTVAVNSGSGSGSYAENADVTITANTPSSGKRFKEWTGTDGLAFISGNKTTATATFTMPAKSVSVTATYEDVPQTTYAVTVNGGSGSGRYAENERVTIAASIPESGKWFKFKEWAGADGLNFINGDKNSSSATFTMPARNVTLTATTAESFFTEPIYTAPTSDKYITATSALIREYQYVEDASPEGATYRSGRLIVDANNPLPDLSRFKPAQIVVDNQNNYLIQFSQPGNAESCAKYLESLSYVSYVEPDGIIKEFSTKIPLKDGRLFDTEKANTIAVEIRKPASPSVAATPNSWGVSAIGADTYAADLLKRGISSSVTVAVVDTGVDSTHPFLSGRVLSGYDLVDDDATPQDGDGHGTHVSGTVVDCTPGLNVKVLPVRVLNDEGKGHYATVAQGIRYAAEHGANVINLSLGGGHSASIESAISYAISKNITVVVAAGNDNIDTSNVCPAHVKSAITVAAVDSGKTRAYFSNYGDAVDIAAPGMNIKSCIPGGKYDSYDGTSMASPHVSAAAALLLYENGSLTPAQVEAKLRDTAIDLGATGWDKYYGTGFLSLSGSKGTPVDSAPIEFTDVPKDAYYYKAVMWAVEKGITNGTTSTTFSPHNTCSTAQILTFIWRAVGTPEPESSEMSVSSNSYFGKAMRWADEKDITGIFAENSSDTPCTRASAMVYMWGIAGKPVVGSNPFADVASNSGYAEAVSWGVQRGVTNGTTPNTFSPDRTCTRAQIITFLYRYYVESL